MIAFSRSSAIALQTPPSEQNQRSHWVGGHCLTHLGIFSQRYSNAHPTRAAIALHRLIEMGVYEANWGVDERVVEVPSWGAGE